MNALRRTRHFGRLLAAWLLLSFIAMTAMPMGAMGSALLADDICVQADGEREGIAQARPLRAGHGDGSLSHCPLCMHAAAPPPAPFAQRLAPEAPVAPIAAAPRSAARVLTAAPPPARGPPVFS